MKRWSTTPVSSSSFAAKAAVVACAVMMAISMPIQMSRTAYASNYDARIAEQRALAAESLAQAGELSIQAATLEEELARLTQQIQSIQGQISDTQGELKQLQSEIKQLEEEIKISKKVLGATILDMDAAREVSTLEMVASSKNISDIVDSWEQQNAIQNKLNDDLDKLTELRVELNKKQDEITLKLETLESQRAQVAAIQGQQAQLVKETRGEEAAYRERADKNNKRAEELIAAQAEENRRAAAAAAQAAGGTVPSGVAGGGGYPGLWANAPLNAYVDTWGLYSRQCVSYTAWKVWSTGRHVPHFAGMGNANQWPSTTARHGISNGSTPKVGAVAIQYIGVYGHTMYVEAVNPDGSIVVSDYNLEWDGLYRKYTRSSAGLTYIYF